MIYTGQYMVMPLILLLRVCMYTLCRYQVVGIQASLLVTPVDMPLAGAILIHIDGFAQRVVL